MGTGGNIALGAMYASTGVDNPEARIITALEAAATYNACCRPPFMVLDVPYVENLRKAVKRVMKPKSKRKKKKRG
jgi:hypothetical protein